MIAKPAGDTTSPPGVPPRPGRRPRLRTSRLDGRRGLGLGQWRRRSRRRRGLGLGLMTFSGTQLCNLHGAREHLGILAKCVILLIEN